MKKIILFSIIAFITVILITGGLTVLSYFSYNNQEVVLRETFNQNIKDRTALIDNMFKVVKKKSKVALKNDSSFVNVVSAVMSGRKDGKQVMMKWVTEQNPTANFKEVSDMYKDLSRTIESKQDELLEKENELARIEREHNILLEKFPGSLFLSSKSKLNYKPITSDHTDEIIRTGKDNDLTVF